MFLEKHSDHFPKHITIVVWGSPHQMVNLACKTAPSAYSKCYWSHGKSKIRLVQAPANDTRKTK